MTDSVHHLRYTVSLINSCWTLTLEFTEFGQKSQNQSRHYETEEKRFCVLAGMVKLYFALFVGGFIRSRSNLNKKVSIGPNTKVYLTLL